jgi:hypothetical protein
MSAIRRIANKFLAPFHDWRRAPKEKAQAEEIARRLNDPTLAAKLVGSVDPKWRERIDTALACPDNTDIPRCANAGKLDGNLITMHNGIRVGALSYYGAGILNLLIENRGVHEPQEEKVFAAVLDALPQPDAMLELGAYWGFYSLWFKQKFPDARVVLVEPSLEGMMSGQFNFKVNKVEGEFIRARIGDYVDTASRLEPQLTVDAIVESHQLRHLAILHCDIQGHESEMLRGATKTLEQRIADYIFISTHSEELHASCRKTLEDFRYTIIAQHTVAESYSYDGLLVARRKELKGIEHFGVSHRSL